MSVFNSIMAAIANPIGALAGKGNDGGTIWNHDNGYNVSSAGESANEMTGTGLDPFGHVSGIWNDLTGVTAQSREFSQQEYLMDKQNDYNTFYQQMKRAKEAGINANTAAAGIVGNGNISAQPPAVNSNTSGASAGLGAVSSGVSSASQAKLNSSVEEANKAKAALDFANARNVDRLADADILSKAGVFAQALTAAGTPEIAAMEFALTTVRGGLDGLAALLKGDGICRMIETQQSAIEADYSMKWKEIEKAESEIQLLQGKISEQDYLTQIAEIEKKKQDLILWREQQTNQMWQRFDGDPYLGEYQLMANLRMKYGEDSPQYQGILKQARDMMYNQSKGQFDADTDTAFERFRNRLQGEDTGKRVNAKFFADLENYRSLFNAISELYFSSNGSLGGLAHRIISIFGSEFGLSTNEIEQMFKDAQQPAN